MADGSINLLADRFLGATIHKWGTDEGEVYSVLEEVYRAGKHLEFDRAVYQKSAGRPLFGILNDELSGAALTKSVDLFRHGVDTHRASFVAHYLDGLSNVVDFSSGWSKVGLIGVPVLVGGLTLISPIAGAMLVSTMLVAGATVGGLMLIYQGVTLVATLIAGTEGNAKEAMRGVGTASGILVLFLPPVTQVPQLIKLGGSARSLASRVPHFS